jgi:hypothetical protein
VAADLERHDGDEGQPSGVDQRAGDHDAADIASDPAALVLDGDAVALTETWPTPVGRLTHCPR